MATRKFVSAAVFFVAVGPMATAASAITVEVAKACEVLTAKAFPPRQLGNPASGSAKGTSQSERAYYNKCVAGGGKVNDGGSSEAK
jgi:phage tail sheath protein FI